jgi:hypothetical protein
LLLIYIKQNWRGYYINKFLKVGEEDPSCAQDQDPPPDKSVYGDPCKTSLEENGVMLITAVVDGVVEQITDWWNWLYLIMAAGALKMLGYKWAYALLIFLPINSIQGIIYYITFASKYSPINFIFGRTGVEENPIIYDNASRTDGRLGVVLKNFTDKFYIMYIVLILLIFFTIIIRLTTDTIISCNNFKSPIPIDLLQGCKGYRIYMVFNVILFIGFSTDFIDSLQKISLDDTILTCPWGIDSSTGAPLGPSEQLYTSRESECKLPKDIIKTDQFCNVEEHIIECDPGEKESPLKGCKLNRTDYRNDNYTLREISDYNAEHQTTRRIIIKETPGQGGYKIDLKASADHGLTYDALLLDPDCKKSIKNWLRNSGFSPADFTKDPYVKPVSAEAAVAAGIQGVASLAGAAEAR